MNAAKSWGKKCVCTQLFVHGRVGWDDLERFFLKRAVFSTRVFFQGVVQKSSRTEISVSLDGSGIYIVLYCSVVYCIVYKKKLNVVKYMYPMYCIVLYCVYIYIYECC